MALGHPHITIMAHWQASITKAPPKSKAELRQMLTEAVRNTQAEAEQRPKHQAKSKSEQA
jgi:hypothetical protein